MRLFRQAATTAEEPLFDAAFRQRLERLAIRTRQTLTWRGLGEHRSPRRTPSREFVDFRPYSQGEDLRYVDWNTFARLGELVTRLGEASTELTVHILLDTSASMNWGAPNKLWYAKRLAAALGYITLWHFDRVTVSPFDAGLRESFGPRRGRAAVAPLFSYLAALPAGGATDLTRVLHSYARRRQPRGVLLLVSDLLSMNGDPFGSDGAARAALTPLLEQGWEVVVFHTLDAEEVEPTFNGDLRLIDVEGDAALRVTPDERTLHRYREAIDGWLAGIEDYCRGHRVGYLRVLTAWPFETLILRFLQEEGLLGHPSDRRRLAVAR